MREHKTDVLVVGAGPTGLLTAILLGEAGINVEIIDREERTAARSYACALHPETLELFGQLGLASAVFKLGRRIRKVALYDNAKRRAEIQFSSLGGEYAFLLVVPQSDLETMLEERLARASRVRVKWNHRLDGIEQEEGSVSATVEELEGTSLGYIVPHWETVVKRRTVIRARFVVGADGHNSMVRQRLGINYENLGGPQAFVACEFSPGGEVEDELRVVLDEGTTNVFWPLPGNECRWTFQLIHTDPASEFPEKDRRALPSERTLNERIRKGLEKLIVHRAPWFSAGVGDIAWCKRVAFEHRLAKRFGQDHCWLAGDAAHQTGPVGVQSMNAGLREAAALAARLQKILKAEAPLNSLAAYERERQNEWRQLLGLTGGLQARDGADEWVRSRADRILSCIPANGEDLKRLAGQIGLNLE